MIAELCGWLIKHVEKIHYHASSGNMQLNVKIYTYPAYRQIVKTKKVPEDLKRINKGNNSFFLLKRILKRKGVIDLSRTFEVFPVPYYTDMNMRWGQISSIDKKITEKYRESSYYWPLKSKTLREIKNEKWFYEEDVKKWIFYAVRFLWKTVKFPEMQNKRLGAENAYILGIGDCDEFTDLFVSIARIRGIPARRVTGFFMRQEPEPHAWSEIYIHGRWIIVDAALKNIGEHSPKYIILKVEEFKSDLPDYQFSWKGGTLKYRVEKEVPVITPLFCK